VISAPATSTDAKKGTLVSVQPCHPLAEPGAPPLERCVRRPVSLTAYATRDDGSVVDLTLTDLSYDGCGVDCAAGLIGGERLRLAVNRRGSIAATVRWSATGKAGLAFDATQEAGPALVPRGHNRVDVEGEVTLRRAGKVAFRVRLFDLSPAGCKAEFVDRPELGEMVRIKFDAMESLEGTICWVAGTKAGIRFVRPIYDAVFSLLVDRLNATPGR
jgi:PilZ domain-containing protein